MEDFVREAMHAGALGLSTGLEFNPGRMAPTDELVRLNKVVGEYDGYYTSHIRNRDSQLQESIEEFLTIVREGGTHGEISHLNVRNRTGARRGSVAARRRHDADGARGRGNRRPRRHDAVQGRPRPDGRDPAAVGDGRRLGEDVRAPARRDACASGCATSATATGASSTAASGTARGCSRASSSPSSRARTSTRSPRCMGKDQWDAYFDILAAAGPALESILLIGELFTDEHLTEMITHPLISLGVDGFTSAVDSPLAAVTAHPVCFAGHVHYLTRHVGELQSLLARGGDPEDDRRCPPSTSGCATAAGSRPGARPTSSCSTSTGSRTARRSTTRSTTCAASTT